MPELPEVETVARQLAPHLIGRELLQLTIIDKKLLSSPSLVEWLGNWDEGRSKNNLCASGERYTVSAVVRLGKRVAIVLGVESTARPPRFRGVLLLVHLRMTGALLRRGGSEQSALPALLHRESFSEKEKHLRARFVFAGGEVHFYDPRRFGTIECFPLSVHERTPSRETLSQCAGITGVEPLSEEFDAQALLTLVKGTKQPIKQWLLRQDRVLGIGNIYACEVLFAAQVSPHRAAGTLSVLEAERIVAATKAILTRAIECSGTTFSDFKDTTGGDGGFAEFLSVYDRESEPCSRCLQPIVRCVQAQRSTFFCTSCQR